MSINKSDINEKKKTVINTKLLSERLNCPVIETISTDSDDADLSKLAEVAVSLAGKGQKAPFVQNSMDLISKSAVKVADRKRFEFVNKIVKDVEDRKVYTSNKNFQDKIDRAITNKWLGIPIFAVIMFIVFDISQSTLGPFLGDILSGWIDLLYMQATSWLEGVSPILSSIVLDGIIGGVGAVLGFLPLVMVMYFLIALLEDCGYMARVSVVLDPIFKKVGLSGKSVIPFVIGTGCAVPGVMACRTIRN